MKNHHFSRPNYVLSNELIPHKRNTFSFEKNCQFKGSHFAWIFNEILWKFSCRLEKMLCVWFMAFSYGKILYGVQNSPQDRWCELLGSCWLSTMRKVGRGVDFQWVRSRRYRSPKYVFENWFWLSTLKRKSTLGGGGGFLI